MAFEDARRFQLALPEWLTGLPKRLRAGEAYIAQQPAFPREFGQESPLNTTCDPGANDAEASAQRRRKCSGNGYTAKGSARQGPRWHGLSTHEICSEFASLIAGATGTERINRTRRHLPAKHRFSTLPENFS